MAKPVSEITLGIDVSKDELVVCDWDTEQLTRLANEASEIEAWLACLHGPVRMAVEPTSSYHLALIEKAQALGHRVYLINPRQLAHYRQAVNLRNKTDPADAWLLARYLAHEAKTLRRFQPLDARARQLWALLKRRALIVQTRQQLQQSFRDITLSAQALFTELAKVLRRIDQRLQRLLHDLGWHHDYQRCLSIPGVGPLNAIALVAAYRRGVFAGADAFIAFIGLDVRLRESGRYQGQRRLTKRGEAELRRLLFCAAQPARQHPPFQRYYQRQLDKGLSKTAAKCILARKIARIAFALISHQTDFKKPFLACSQRP